MNGSLKRHHHSYNTQPPGFRRKGPTFKLTHIVFFFLVVWGSNPGSHAHQQALLPRTRTPSPRTHISQTVSLINNSAPLLLPSSNTTSWAHLDQTWDPELPVSTGIKDLTVREEAPSLSLRMSPCSLHTMFGGTQSLERTEHRCSQNRLSSSSVAPSPVFGGVKVFSFLQ